MFGRLLRELTNRELTGRYPELWQSRCLKHSFRSPSGHCGCKKRLLQAWKAPCLHEGKLGGISKPGLYLAMTPNSVFE